MEHIPLLLAALAVALIGCGVLLVMTVIDREDEAVRERQAVGNSAHP